MRRFQMNKMRWLQLFILLFVLINFVLVAVDDEGKVDRVSYVNEWTESFTTNMNEELAKPTVLAPEWEIPIYFDQNQGTFKEFLVEEGDVVNSGQDLFSYQVDNYYEAEAKLLNELARVESEITATEQAIAEMEAYPITTNPQASPAMDQEGIFIKIPSTSVEAEFMKEQFLAEKNQELATKNGEKTALDSQLESLRESGDTITFSAPQAGRVNHISTTLDAPILILESVELAAWGELTEAERTEVEEGMEAEIVMTEIDETIQGTVESVAPTPEKLTLEGTSVYPFTVMLENEDEVADDGDAELEEKAVDLLPGYHGTLSINLEERLNTTAIKKSALFGQAVWKMNADGRLVKQKVETGLEEDGQIEIMNEMQEGTVLAEAPERELRDGAYYMTPLQWSKLTSKSFNMKETDWQKGFVSGVISR